MGKTIPLDGRDSSAIARKGSLPRTTLSPLPMHFSVHVTRVMSVVIRQIVFLTISASWCYRFESRDSAGSAPNNNITKARRLIISKN